MPTEYRCCVLQLSTMVSVHSTSASSCFSSSRDVGMPDHEHLPRCRDAGGGNMAQEAAVASEWRTLASSSALMEYGVDGVWEAGRHKNAPPLPPLSLSLPSPHTRRRFPSRCVAAIKNQTLAHAHNACCGLSSLLPSPSLLFCAKINVKSISIASSCLVPCFSGAGLSNVCVDEHEKWLMIGK